MKKILSFVLPFGILLSSCGDSTKPVETPKTDTSSVKTPSTPGEAKITITVTGSTMADMAYEPTSSSVKAGDKVTLTLINTNTMEGMIHNWVLVKLGTGQEVATAAIAAGMDKGYIPENPNVIAASPLAQPKETVSFTFTAPAAGSYNYICTYPGHFPKMLGKLIVE